MRLVLALVAMGSPAWAQGILPYDDPAAVAAGEEIYAEHCAACHGARLEGEPDWRVADADGYLPAPPHDETGHTWHHRDALLVQIVTLGSERLIGGGYKSHMMGFGDVLSPDEILNVLGYIKSTWPDEIIEMHDNMNAVAPD